MRSRPRLCVSVGSSVLPLMLPWQQGLHPRFLYNPQAVSGLSPDLVTAANVEIRKKLETIIDSMKVGVAL